MAICFFVRCKPQGADAIELVRRTSRVFLGYPPYREGRFSSANPGNVPETIYDLSVDEPRKLDLSFLQESRDRRSYSREVSKNANLIREVVQAPGSLVLVPRPESGLCFLGSVLSFELVNDPPWLSEYKALRLAQAPRLQILNCDVWSDERNHLGDVVQTFVSDNLKAIPFFAIPAWIRHQLFGRATAGRIHPKLAGHQPHAVLSEIFASSSRPVDVSYTTDLLAIEERLLNFTTPAILEHLFCELLQLENPLQYWWHVGGAGDGGVDALGFDPDGEIVGAAQCKLSALGREELIRIGQDMMRHFPERPRRQIFVCSLYAELDEVRDDNVFVYGRQGIVRLLFRHKDRSVFAAMLGLRPPA